MVLRNYEEHEKNTVSTVVNQLVANQGVLFGKLNQYHWFVQGPHFFTLHEKFEELYNESNEYLDAFAERLLAKGDKPYSTLGEYLEHAAISEKKYDEKMSAEEMVRQLIDDYRTIKNIVLEGVELAGTENDAVTEDLLIGYKDSIDQTVWMLEAYLGNDVPKK